MEAHETPIRLPGPLTADERRTVDAVVSMYRDGWFPMDDPDGGGVQWVQPRRRAIIPLDGAFRVPRSLRQRVRSRRFIITSDAAFSRVIRECARPAAGRERTWLQPEIVAAFDALHAAGLAHSIEAWAPAPTHAEGATLVGGLYGVAIGSVFCGESMFSRPDLGGTDASKVCLVHLVQHLRARGFEILDAQLHNEHLAQFGLVEVARGRFLQRVEALADRPCPWQPFDPEHAPRALSCEQGGA